MLPGRDNPFVPSQQCVLMYLFPECVLVNDERHGSHPQEPLNSELC